MVAPMESSLATCSKSSRKFVGNDQVVDLKENRSRTSVIGNGCKVKIERNDAPLKIIGNRCSVEVKEGAGSIVYVGNDGEVKIGASVRKGDVSYTGNGGRIIRWTERREEEEEEEEVVKVKDTGVNLENVNSVRISHVSGVQICSHFDLGRIIRDEVMKRKKHSNNRS